MVSTSMIFLLPTIIMAVVIWSKTATLTQFSFYLTPQKAINVWRRINFAIII